MDYSVDTSQQRRWLTRHEVANDYRDWLCPTGAGTDITLRAGHTESIDTDRQAASFPSLTVVRGNSNTAFSPLRDRLIVP